MSVYFVRKPVRTFVVANIIFYIAYSILVAELAPTKESLSLQVLTVFLSLILFLLVFVLPTTRKGKERILSGLEKKPYQAVYIVLPFLVVFSLATLLILILALLSLLGILPIPAGFASGADMADVIPKIEILAPAVLVMRYLNTVVIAPIVEEIGFRGVLFNALNWKKGVMFSLIISSLVFGVMHGGDMVTATFMGILLGYIYHITGDLRMSMAAHMFNNFMVLTLPYLVPTILGNEVLLNFLAVGAALLSVVTLVYFIRLLRKNKAYLDIVSPLYRSGEDESPENRYSNAEEQVSKFEVTTSQCRACVK